MTGPGASASQFSPRTVWARRLETPLRRFLRTETGSAAVLLHQGAYDISTLSEAVRTARTRTLIRLPRQPRRAS